ncbi:hypothetical protein FB451DRAFT_1167737 [Mycena latifolia]|nr:hypothetical protein FB451DRAFT_1167737 [Mycena latifolia]
MMFTSPLLLLALGLSVAAGPLRVASQDGEVAVRDTVPNASVLPLTVFSVFQTLKVAVDAILPGIDSIVAAEGPAGSAGSVAPLLTELTEALNTATTSLASLSPGDAGAANQDIATLVVSTLDSANTALNKLVPKLGLDGLLTPVDGALTGLLTSLGGILPPVLALVGGVLIPVGGLVGSLLSGLGLAAL